MGEHLHFWPTRWVNYTHACVMISRVASILCTELGFTCQPAPKLCQVDNGVIKKIAHCVLQIQDDNNRTVYLDFKRFDGYLEHGDTIEVFHRATETPHKLACVYPKWFGAQWKVLPLFPGHGQEDLADAARGFRTYILEHETDELHLANIPQEDWGLHKYENDQSFVEKENSDLALMPTILASELTPAERAVLSGVRERCLESKSFRQLHKANRQRVRLRLLEL